MPVKKTLYVLGRTGQRQEADVIRRALASPDLDVRVGLASAHVSGQTMRGDVVVIGAASSAIEADTTGEVYCVDGLEDLEQLAPKLLGREPAPAPGGASPAAPEPEPEPEMTPPEQHWYGSPAGNGDDDGEAPSDDLDVLDAEMHEIATMCGVELPEGKVTNDGLRDIAESLGIELSVAYVKNADLVAMIRRETQGLKSEDAT